jgi:hypothetical protein
MDLTLINPPNPSAYEATPHLGLHYLAAAARARGFRAAVLAAPLGAAEELRDEKPSCSTFAYLGGVRCEGVPGMRSLGGLSYFGAYICPDCDWFDNTIGLERQRRYVERSSGIRRERPEEEDELVVGAK